MKAKFIWASTCIFFYALQNGAFGQAPSDAQHAAKIESLAKEYNSFGRKDWKKRRDFCIRLIDERVISTSSKVEDTRRIFAPDLHYNEASDKRPAGGYVQFERPSKEDAYVHGQLAQARNGWHFSFESSSNGYLWNYHLTDCQK